jgi:hypothetical protein
MAIYVRTCRNRLGRDYARWRFTCVGRNLKTRINT